MAGKSYKPIIQSTTALSAISSFFSEIEELASECRELVDNVVDNLKNTGRIQIFDETASVLEGMQEVDAPDDLPDVAGVGLETFLSITQYVPRPKNGRTSRAVRCENACIMGRAGIDAVRAYLDAPEFEDPADELHDLLTEWRDFCVEIEGYLDEAEGVEFPGMFG